jgi:hypothetical protein
MAEVWTRAARLWQKSSTSRDWVDAVWKNPWMGASLLLAFYALGAYWWYVIPSPGKAVASLAAVATVMTFRGELKGVEKTFLTLALFLFVWIEIRAIDKDQADNEERQRKFFEVQKTSFGQIATQASTNFSDTTGKLTSAIDGLNAVLGTTQSVAAIAKQNLEAVSGGTSFAYVIPDNQEFQKGGVTIQHEGAAFSMTLINHGNNMLTGVSVTIAKVVDQSGKTDYGVLRPYAMGTLAKQGSLKLPVFIKPETNDQGLYHYVIMVSAQNGTIMENLYFRPSKDGNGWAYKFNVVRNLPGKSDIKILNTDWKEPVIVTDSPIDSSPFQPSGVWSPRPRK